MSTVKSHVEGTTLIMERLFKAPRQLVFEAFSTSAHLEKWWGPSGWETKVYSFDFKPEGIWHYCMTCVDKEQGDFYDMESWGKSTFIDIDPYSRIVYTAKPRTTDVRGFVMSAASFEYMRDRALQSKSSL